MSLRAVQRFLPDPSSLRSSPTTQRENFTLPRLQHVRSSAPRCAAART